MTSLTDTQVVTASGGLVELGYSQIISSVTVNNGTAGTGVEVIAPFAVVCDGSPILVEFFSPEVRPWAAANYEINISLFEDGVEKIRSWGRNYNSTSSFDNKPMQLQARLTPSAGSHTYSVKSYVTNTSPSTNTGFIGAGTGTTGSAPAFLRVSKIVQATQWPAVTTGTIICTSSTRPASPFVGQSIYETDTSLSLTWSGSAWVSPPLAFKPPSVRCLATGTSQTLPTGALTAITFPAEDYDTDSMHSTSSNTSRVTVPYAGLYLVNNYITTGAAGGNRYIYILKNGAQWMFKAAVTDPTSSSSAGIVDSICAIVPCAANDYIESGIFHNTGSAISVGTGSWMSVSYFGKYT